MEITPPGRLAYIPVEPPQAPSPADIFSEAEVLEIRNQDRIKAAEIYARLAESDSAQVRAEALASRGACRE